MTVPHTCLLIEFWDLKSSGISLLSLFIMINNVINELIVCLMCQTFIIFFINRTTASRDKYYYNVHMTDESEETGNSQEKQQQSGKS